MTVTRLSDHWECFEGIVPSVVATCSRDGEPNVSYISHVFLVDEGHVALSNQFMSKMVRNINENPRLQVVVVHARHGRQLVLDLMFERSESEGSLFDQMALGVTAVAAHHGMEKVMRLRSADVYRILAVTEQPLYREVPSVPRPDTLPAAVALATSLGRVDDLDRAIDLVMDGLHGPMGLRHCMLFLADDERRVLTAIAARGYDRAGTGAEVALGEGVIGLAAERALAVRLSCVGRNFLYLNSVRSADRVTDATRHIPMPGLAAPQSLLAEPMLAGGALQGVIFAESPERLAFSPAEERAVALVAAQLAATVALFESSRELDAALGRTVQPARPAARGAATLVRYHAYDDSVFIGHDYVIKGVPGRLLWRMLRIFATEGRADFTNREFRLDPSLKLPEFKDNLETRLLLLSRRLAENTWPIRILRSGRGRVTLEVAGRVELREQAA
jgi:adenylate cyclase